MPYDGKYFSACLASYVVLLNEEQNVFLMRRTNTGWKDGHYNVPAGKVERHETFLETAMREAEEECGVKIQPQDLQLFLVQSRYDDNQQEKTRDWVDMFFLAKSWSGNAKIAEPDMSDHIGWFALDDLPEKMVANIADALHYLKENRICFGLFSNEYDYFKKKAA